MIESRIEIDGRGISEPLAQAMKVVIDDLQRVIADEIARQVFQRIFPPIGLADWLELNCRLTDRERRGVDNQRGNA